VKRIALIADSHFAEHNRFDECVRIHDWIADDIIKRDVELVLHAGDVFDRKSTSRERYEVGKWIAKITNWCPMVIVRGNHDHPGDLKNYSNPEFRLQTDKPLVIEEAAGVHHIGGCLVAAVSWPRKAEILASIGEPVSAEESSQVAQAELKKLFYGLGIKMDSSDNTWDNDAPRILLMHAMVRGSVTSTGQPIVGADMEVAFDDFQPANCSAYLLGHIHKPQDWEMIDGAPVIYPGSPRRTTFGESEEKDYVILDFEGGKLVNWERVTTPCTPMLLIDAQYCKDAIGSYGESTWTGLFFHEDVPIESLKGAEIRLRYQVEEGLRVEAKKEAERIAQQYMDAGAVFVKLDEDVIHTTRVRASQLAEAVTIDQKLLAMWEFQGRTPKNGETEELLAKIRLIEQEVLANAV